ncbi:hypothetical protein ACQKCJ_13465 [Flavobacterium sp. NPDC079362]|uniref:hypothetical protein n=1 Tax=Flavobacterium sp. NPDC079362 TaxID=3390566 RepID=UPI003D08D428
MEQKINTELDTKPIPVPIIYQPIYKLILLLAILKYGTAKPYNSIFLKIHLYMWGLRSVENLEVLKDLKKGIRNSISPWTFEPGLEKTITLAIINDLCTREVKSNELKIQLTPLGESFILKIEKSKHFIEDFQKIKSIGIIPQNVIQSANHNWKINL